MNPLTHKILADNILQTLKNDFQEEVLLRKSLLWGSVRPDIFRGDISHFKNEGAEKFFKKYEKVDKSSVVMTGREFSCSLGQIFHYLSDFFCQAHNSEKYFDRRSAHLLNEIKLQQFAQKKSFNYFVRQLQKKAGFDVNKTTSSTLRFQELIENKHALFMEDKFCFKNDLIYSFGICVLAGRRLIENKVKRENKIRVA